MPHFKCLPCKTRLYSTESQAGTIGHLRPVRGSPLEPVGDLGEIVGYRLLETRGRTWHSGAPGAGQLIADRVGEIIAQRELKHARVGLEIERCDPDSVSLQVQPMALALPARATKPWYAAAALTPQPRRCDCQASSKLSAAASSALTAPPDEVRLAPRRHATHRHEPVCAARMNANATTCQ